MRSRGRTVGFVAWAALVLLALRPVPAADRALSWALAPLRALAELCAPLGWLRAGELHAADRFLAQEAAREDEGRRALLDALVASAEPTGALREGRRLVPGAVVGRSAESLDHLVVRVPADEHVQRGQPVVVGAAYVGRVGRRLGPDVIEVELATGARFHVGAVVPAGEPRGRDVMLTVGGVVARRRTADERLRLAVHNPSDRAVQPGPVLVRELLVGRDPLDPGTAFGALAEGFGLGWLERDESGVRVVPLLDFQSGLYQVTILAPPAPGPVGDVAEELTDGGWRRARALTSGDPNAARRGLKLDAGALRGVEPGAAVASGLRLLGRVERAAALWSDVRLLSDPGIAVVCLARIEGEPAPRVLGRMVGRGRDEDGALVFDWRPQVPLVVGDRAEGTVRAELFTGSGESGLPRGLLVGPAELPLGAPSGGPHRVRVEANVDGLDVGDLWVRVAPDAGDTP